MSGNGISCFMRSGRDKLLDIRNHRLSYKIEQQRLELMHGFSM